MPETYRMTDYRPPGGPPPQYYNSELDLPASVHPRSRSNSDQPLVVGREPRDHGGRTPSPTPSEIASLNGTSSGIIPWDKFKSKEFWFSKKGICKYQSLDSTTS